MSERETQGNGRSQQVLDMVELGSLLVFASVMPAMTFDDDAIDAAGATMDDATGLRGLGATAPLRSAER